ncbi:MAG: M28 family peptidase [Gemmatimonadota bacterium]|nr:M28 family peptidase [Gemmatimonadota bacterium]
MKSGLLVYLSLYIVACSSTGVIPIDPVESLVSNTTSRSPSPYEEATIRAAATIRAEDIISDIAFLANDELAGRDTPSPGLETAAEYLVDRFTAAGLEPGGDDGTFIQRFPYTSTTMVKSARIVAYEGVSGTEVFDYARDYYVIPGQRTAIGANVIFGGFAAEPLSGLAPISRENVVLFIVDGNPVVGTGEQLISAFQAAGQAGASAVVLLLDETNVADSIMDLATGLAGSGLVTPLPIVGLSLERARQLLDAAGLNLAVMRASPFETAMPLEGITMTVSAPFEVAEHTPPNVVGILPGRDPLLRDQYIVYTAHFDHVGIRVPDESGDSIYNGADDNASGTSLLLATAAAFGTLEVRPARSVLFLAVSGEEKGLLGSKYFSENPTVPLEGIIMNINTDMVGRNHPDTLIGVGRQYTNLGPLTDRILTQHPELGFTVIEDPKPEDQAFFRSDHLHFVNKDIPAIFFTSWDHEDYHQPSDEVDFIDSEKVARVARMVFYLGAWIADGLVNPEWTETGLAEVRRILEGGN